MVTTTTTLQPSRQRFFPNLKGIVPYHAEVEFTQLRTLIYDLLDRQFQVYDVTMTKDTLVNPDTKAGRPLIVFLRQDATGGWLTTFAPKFKGMTTGLGTLDVTANTYTAIFFYPTTDTEVMLLGGITGANL